VRLRSEQRRWDSCLLARGKLRDSWFGGGLRCGARYSPDIMYAVCNMIKKKYVVQHNEMCAVCNTIIILLCNTMICVLCNTMEFFAVQHNEMCAVQHNEMCAV
jgi:hypothetical protein